MESGINRRLLISGNMWGVSSEYNYGNPIPDGVLLIAMLLILWGGLFIMML